MSLERFALGGLFRFRLLGRENKGSVDCSHWHNKRYAIPKPTYHHEGAPTMLNCALINSNFQKLRREKAARENRDLPLRTIAEEAQLALATVHKISTGNVSGVRLSSIDALCHYFGVSSIAELIEFKR